MDFTLRNDGADTEAGVMLPYVFYNIEQERPLRFFDPVFGGNLKTTAVPMTLVYPGQASFCLTAAAGDAATIACGLFDSEQRRVVLRHTPAVHNGQIRFNLERVFIGSGQEIKLPTLFICVAGTWGEAFLPYRKWFNETFPRVAPRPSWLSDGGFNECRKAHCLVPYKPFPAPSGVLGFDNEQRLRSFDEIKAEIDEAFEMGEKNNFSPLFYQFGWWERMATFSGLYAFDSFCGDYTKAHSFTRQSVDYIHARGGKVYLYTNIISAGDETDAYGEHPELFARDAAGFPLYNSGYPMLMFCPGAPGMREYWRRNVDYILKDMDADGLFLDQVCGGFPPQYCYCEAHDHSHPDTYGADMIELVKHIRAYAKSIKPDCYVGGELMLDSRSVLLDETHGYGYTGPPDYAAALDRGEPMPEYYIFAKYICPDLFSSFGSCVMDGSAGSNGDSVWLDNRKCFEAGITPCATDERDSVAYLFGPAEGRAVLAVRSAKPCGIKATLPDKTTVSVETNGIEPVYEPLRYNV